jgi:hypothetical protein
MDSIHTKLLTTMTVTPIEKRMVLAATSVMEKTKVRERRVDASRAASNRIFVGSKETADKAEHEKYLERITSNWGRQKTNYYSTDYTQDQQVFVRARRVASR